MFVDLVELRARKRRQKQHRVAISQASPSALPKSTPKKGCFASNPRAHTLAQQQKHAINSSNWRLGQQIASVTGLCTALERYDLSHPEAAPLLKRAQKPSNAAARARVLEEIAAENEHMVRRMRAIQQRRARREHLVGADRGTWEAWEQQLDADLSVMSVDHTVGFSGVLLSPTSCTTGRGPRRHGGASRRRRERERGGASSLPALPQLSARSGSGSSSGGGGGGGGHLSLAQRSSRKREAARRRDQLAAVNQYASVYPDSFWSDILKSPPAASPRTPTLLLLPPLVTPPSSTVAASAAEEAQQQQQQQGSDEEEAEAKGAQMLKSQEDMPGAAAAAAVAATALAAEGSAASGDGAAAAAANEYAASAEQSDAAGRALLRRLPGVAQLSVLSYLSPDALLLYLLPGCMPAALRPALRALAAPPTWGAADIEGRSTFELKAWLQRGALELLLEQEKEQEIVQPSLSHRDLRSVKVGGYVDLQPCAQAAAQIRERRSGRYRGGCMGVFQRAPISSVLPSSAPVPQPVDSASTTQRNHRERERLR